ncbi:MAG: BolA family transcriptional regulator [Burkholderiales bacterium]|jgi:BolA protein|nr:BolA family transcriptional regulator [Burkholderiales bacterium]
MADTRVALIEARLRAALEPQSIAIDDESHKHAGHAGAASGGGHYRVHVVSRRFAGLPRLARHRLVYDALADLMHHDIHALALTLATPDE